MPVPLAFAPIIGKLGAGVVAGLVAFFASKAGLILAGLGLTFIGVKGLEVFLGYVINDINTLVSAVGSMGGGVDLGPLGSIMLQYAAYSGLFDGINILISGYISMGSIAGLRVLARALR